MSLQDLSSAEAVRRALDEFDVTGRAVFLAKYGFGEAKSYFVERGGRRYDSKAVVAAAHGYQFGQPLVSSDFSGGDATVARRLERLGFKVSRPLALPDWSTSELILALNVYLTTGIRSYSANTSAVIELSTVLRQLREFPDNIRADVRFRNPAGVALKMANFRSIDPSHQGVGMDHGGQKDQQTWKDWAHRPRELAQIAARILAVATNESLSEPVEDEVDVGAPEGAALYRKHRRLERDRALVRRKKNQVLEDTGKLACEVCDFESAELYGPAAEGVIDVHHIVPLHKIGESRTRLSDLSLVCPTCHRVVHRHRPFLTPQQLRAVRARRGVAT